MNDDQLDDLKQFIASTVSQTGVQLTGEIKKLEQKVDDGFMGVGEAIEAIHKLIDERDTEVDQRSAKLEQKAA
ncbi:hypothetical protein HY218_02485 [Candidatus Saccharibacteria bacterium]|nr:hypothetical protein [Candidatus Saccharibacteria bacterium]